MVLLLLYINHSIAFTHSAHMGKDCCLSTLVIHCEMCLFSLDNGINGNSEYHENVVQWHTTGLISDICSRRFHLSVSSLQFGFSSAAERCFTPESPILFSDRSRAFRCEEFDIRAEARAVQPSSVISQPSNLQKNTKDTLNKF